MPDVSQLRLYELGGALVGVVEPEEIFLLSVIDAGHEVGARTYYSDRLLPPEPHCGDLVYDGAPPLLVDSIKKPLHQRQLHHHQ